MRMGRVSQFFGVRTWYMTSDTSLRMWLKADWLWLMTPKSILPCAAGRHAGGQAGRCER